MDNDYKQKRMFIDVFDDKNFKLAVMPAGIQHIFCVNLLLLDE